MLSAKQGNYWYHFYYVFGMTQNRLYILPSHMRCRVSNLLQRWKTSTLPLSQSIW